MMTRRRRLLACYVASLIGLLSVRMHGQVTPQRLTAAASEPQNWLTYSGNYSSQRFSLLDQITPANVKNLKLQWVYQSPVAGNWQTTPLVVDGVMYITQRPNDVVALDAVTGRAFWIYRYTPNPDRIVCCGANNRGVAILGDTLFMGTLDANLIAIDAKRGRQVWKTEVATTKSGYSITHAPLVIKDKVIVGVGGGEYGIRGFIAAYNADTGKEAWRFYTIPGPGEKGHETWEPVRPSPRPSAIPKHGSTVAGRSGSPARTIPSSISRIGEWATWDPTTTAHSGLATTSTPTRSSHWMPIRARSDGTTSSRRTMSTTTTRSRFRCLSTTGETGMNALSGPIATGTSTCWIVRREVPARPPIRESQLDERVR